MLEIIVPSRIHLTLIDLAKTGYRRNGGIGFCVDSPAAVFNFEKSSLIDISALGYAGFSSGFVKSLGERLNSYRSTHGSGGMLLKNVSIPEPHSGFGSGTAAALACFEAFSDLNKLNACQAKLVELSGRGGTSGIGIYSYFTGGFTYDVGRPFDEEEIVSSDDVTRPTAIPTRLLNSVMPNWPIGIVRFDNSAAVPIAKERQLFADVLPLTQAQVYQLAYLSTFGVAAAIAEGNYDGFCRSVNEIQFSAWKAHEISLHGASLRLSMDQMLNLGCDAVGMSSMGPGLFFLAKDMPFAVDSIQKRFPGCRMSVTTTNNTGRNIRYV